MFATDSNKDEGSPFDPNSYSGDINKAGTGRPSSDGTNQYHRYNAGTSGSSYGSYSSGYFKKNSCIGAIFYFSIVIT